MLAFSSSGWNGSSRMGRCPVRSRPIRIPWSMEGEETTKGKLKASEVVSRVRTRRTSSRPWGRTLWKALSCSW